MAWTEITRRKYRRDELRYASDTRAGEWAQIAPLLPAPRRLGRPRERDLRTIIRRDPLSAGDGLSVARLAQGLPATLGRCRGIFYRWRDDRHLASDQCRLVARARQYAGAPPAPSAGIIDSQSAPTAESGGPRASTLASASRDASVISSPIRKASCSPCWCTRPTSRTRRRCAALALATPCLPPAASHLRRPRLSRRTLAQRHRDCRPLDQSRSSSARQASKASKLRPAVGPSSAPLLGSPQPSPRQRLRGTIASATPLAPLANLRLLSARPRKSLIAYDSF